MVSIEMKNIFLSASVPLQGRDDKYFDTADIIAIRDSVIALASTVLPFQKLIWGGHPSITPLIYYVMEKLGTDIQSHVQLYQSNYFKEYFPEDNDKFSNVVYTPDLNNQEISIDFMRSEMICKNEFAAGVFIGGMKGVIDEFNLFRHCHPDAIILPIASTGAAAKIIYENLPFEAKIQSFASEYAYMSLFQSYLLDRI